MKLKKPYKLKILKIQATTTRFWESIMSPPTYSQNGVPSSDENMAPALSSQSDALAVLLHIGASEPLEHPGGAEEAGSSRGSVRVCHG